MMTPMLPGVSAVPLGFLLGGALFMRWGRGPRTPGHSAKTDVHRQDALDIVLLLSTVCAVVIGAFAFQWSPASIIRFAFLGVAALAVAHRWMAHHG